MGSKRSLKKHNNSQPVYNSRAHICTHAHLFSLPHPPTPTYTHFTFIGDCSYSLITSLPITRNFVSLQNRNTCAVSCIQNVKSWLIFNGLEFIDDKSEVMLINSHPSTFDSYWRLLTYLLGVFFWGCEELWCYVHSSHLTIQCPCTVCYVFECYLVWFNVHFRVVKCNEHI